MKLLSQLRIPWVARRWHEREAGVLKRQLDGCQEARRRDTERHRWLMDEKDARIAELEAERDEALKLLGEIRARAIEWRKKCETAKAERDAAQALLAEYKTENARLTDLTRTACGQRDDIREEMEEERREELDDILGLIDAARDYVLERRSETAA